MFDRTQRGAARVSAVWLIVVLVLLGAAMFFGYAASDGQAKAEELTASARAAAAAAEAKLEERSGSTRLVSEVVGFYDTADLSAVTDVELAKQNLEEFKQSIGPAADDTIKTFQAAWPLAIKKVSVLEEQLRTAKARAEELQTQLSAAQSATRDAVSESDAQIASLNQQLNDSATNATDEKNELEASIARLRQEVQQKDSDMIALRAEMSTSTNEATLTQSELQSRLSQLTDMVRPLREPQGFDGEVLSTSTALNLVYVNRGVKDRIVRGMRFSVIDGNPAVDTVVGEIEITDVQENMSEAKVVSLADRFDPITPSDIIANPLYDPEGERSAVLAGRFAGTYNKRELEILLEEIGINVSPELDRSTTFLIVGESLYTDPETGEAVEEPIPISSLAVYKEAQAAGAQIVHISEIRHFFRR